MMDYTRTKINEYAIATQIGNVVYTLYFGTADANINTYSDLFDIIKSTVTTSSWKNASWYHTTEGQTTSTTFPSVSDVNSARLFFKYAYLFNSYQPNDRTMYREDITLPAIANFVINRDKTEQENDAFKLHKAYTNRLDKFYHVTNWDMLGDNVEEREINIKINHIINMMASAGANSYVSTGIPRQKDEEWKGWENPEITSIANQDSYQFKLKYAWSRSGGEKFPEMNYRMGLDMRLSNYGVGTIQGSNYYTNVQEGVTYYGRYSFNNWWNTPNILDVIVTERTNCRIDSSYFTNTSKRLPTHGDNPTVSIVDRITSPIYEDLRIFNSFFQQVFNYAMSFDRRGYREPGRKKETLRYDLYYTDNVLHFDDFPFQIPSFIRSTFYFYTWCFTYSPSTYYYQITSNLAPSSWNSMDKININHSHGIKDEYINIQRFWYDHWMFCEQFPTSYAVQGLNRPSKNENGSRDKVKAHPIFNGLVPITAKNNQEQPVYIDIYYFSPSVGNFDSFCSEIINDIDQTNTSGRILKCTAIYPLEWKFNLNKMTKVQSDNLKKYNKINYIE